MNETTSNGINWDAFFGNAQKGADIFDQVWANIKGPNAGANNQPNTTGGSGLPGWIMWGAIAAVILIVLYMIYKKS